MKKVLFTAAVIATLAGCSNSEIDSVVNEKEINFTNLNDKMTRAANDAGSNYKVYAKTSGGTAWFIDDELYGTKEGTENTPKNGPYYWPTTAGTTVDFYAWAPATVAATGTYPALSIAYTVPSAANEDFTIAAPLTGKASGSGTVAFKFAHMLSKVSVTAELATDMKTAGYSIDLTNAKAVLGVLNSGGSIEPTASPATWTLNGAAASYNTGTSYMIMPQSSTGCSVQLKGVVIKKGAATIFSGDLKSYPIVAGNITGDKFEKSSHYKLKLTVGSSSTDGSGNVIFNEITFSSDLSAGWTDANSSLTQP